VGRRLDGFDRIEVASRIAGVVVSGRYDCEKFYARRVVMIGWKRDLRDECDGRRDED
jgi:hypothetical protein